MNESSKNIAVIGAGVVGLSTALCIQKIDPAFKVTIFADKFENETLSSGAGGLFRPVTTIDPDPQRVKKWCTGSLNHFLEILKSEEASTAGMQLVSGYHLFSSILPIQNKLLQELMPEYRLLHESEMKLFPSHFRSGIFYTTIITDCRYYLQWMMTKFQNNGGIIVKKYVSNISEISEDFAVIVNCAGLGSAKLLADEHVTPIRGQVIKVKAPWIKSFYYGDQVYICPGLDYVTLGGVYDYGSWDTSVRPLQKQFIWNKCTEILPSLTKAEIVWDWVGLRPYRPTVRLDACLYGSNGNYRMVVNNYGHGGHGVTLSHGTALEAAEIVQRLMNENTTVLAKL